MTNAQFDQVSVIKKSNVYFDGKCISHTVLFADGSKKTIGVILPSTLTFNTGAPERMEIISGECSVTRVGQATEQFRSGQSFYVDGNSSFDIEALSVVDYVCHFEG
jgi:uncharacterized protein YaiE (UPF0345 family)